MFVCLELTPAPGLKCPYALRPFPLIPGCRLLSLRGIHPNRLDARHGGICRRLDWLHRTAHGSPWWSARKYANEQSLRGQPRRLWSSGTGAASCAGGGHLDAVRRLVNGRGDRHHRQRMAGSRECEVGRGEQDLPHGTRPLALRFLVDGFGFRQFDEC